MSGARTQDAVTARRERFNFQNRRRLRLTLLCGGLCFAGLVLGRN
jgi:hypothetical protein